jgi:hypothetical protein
MDASTLPKAGSQMVESFSLCLDDFEQALHADYPAKWLEAQLLARLAAPVRLLRWAVVKVENVERLKTMTLDAETGAMDAVALEAGDMTEDMKSSARRFWCEGAYLRRRT